MIGTVEEIELFLCRNLVDFGAGQMLEGRDDFVHVVDDQLFRSEFGLFIQRAAAHTPHVAVYAFVEVEQKAAVIVAGPQSA